MKQADPMLSHVHAGLIGAIVFLGMAQPSAGGAYGQSEWVWIGEDGTLHYQDTMFGDRIPDFSHAGYQGGGVAIPDVPVRMELSPEAGDDTERIQAAIDELGQQPLNDDGFRGAILLKSGVYEISERIEVRDSGIVLRGEGDHKGGTTIRATGQPGEFWTSRLFDLAGTGSHEEVAGTRSEVTAAYVPAGTHEIELEDASHFEVGDGVMVLRRANDQWVSDLGMDRIPPRRDGRTIEQWDPDGFDYRYDRVITAVEGDRITIDAPLGDAINETYGGGAVYQYEYPGRIENVGIEHMRAIAEYEGERDEDGDHFRLFVNLNRVKNAWVRNITSYHFSFGQAQIARDAKWVTIQDCRSLEPAAAIGGSRRYGFYITGQLSLVQRSFANDARHPFGWNQKSPGPNVFLDCSAEGSLNDSGPHHKWSTAGLMDNLEVPDNAIRVQNRLGMGSGHGWAGANFVVWNSRSQYFRIHSPLIANNWAIGNIGDRRVGHFARESAFESMVDPSYLEEHGFEHPPEWGLDDMGDRHWDAHGQRVEPASLYLRQLEERLGPEAVDNIADEPYSFDHGF